jgi:DNA processing protein
MPKRAAGNAADTTVRVVPGLEVGGAVAGLLDLRNPPEHLFVRGSIPSAEPWVAVVGSRSASPYGRKMASRLAGDLARLGLPIVSGLARGIDAAAHEAALAVGGRTVALLPGGVDTIVPPSHDGLARRILASGALMSEFESGPPFGPGAFVRRNRLIAGIAAAVVVVEAARKSGALSTARVAFQIGRPVLAVPGDLDRPTSEGPFALLHLGALPCGGARDVLEALSGSGSRSAGRARGRERAGDPPRVRPESTPNATGGDRGPECLESTLHREMGSGTHTVDALARQVGADVPSVLRGLLHLEWSGLARSVPGGRWRRVAEGE